MKRIAPERFGILTSAVPHLIFPCRGRVSPPPSSPGLLQQLDGCLQPAVAPRLEILIRKDRHRNLGLDADKVVCPSILRQIGAVRQSEVPAVGESSSHRLGEGPLGAVSNSGDVRLPAAPRPGRKLRPRAARWADKQSYPAAEPRPRAGAYHLRLGRRAPNSGVCQIVPTRKPRRQLDRLARRIVAPVPPQPLVDHQSLQLRRCSEDLVQLLLATA